MSLTSTQAATSDLTSKSHVAVVAATSSSEPEQQTNAVHSDLQLVTTVDDALAALQIRQRLDQPMRKRRLQVWALSS